VLIAKYYDHLPLYRQSEIYAREGVDLSRSTMPDWIGKASTLLEPLLVKLQEHVFAGHRLHGDDTVFLCWSLEGTRPRLADCGPMFATVVPTVTRHHRQPATSSVRIVRGNIPSSNWPPSLFAGSEKGGERAAAILSLIETAKLNGLDPEAYLRDILTRIADHPIYTIGELLPWNTAANRI